jgi:hypothetical protein
MASQGDIAVPEKVDVQNEKQALSEISNDSVVNFDGINEKALLRKLDYKLLPPLIFLYLLSFLDRSNSEHSLLSNIPKVHL